MQHQALTLQDTARPAPRCGPLHGPSGPGRHTGSAAWLFAALCVALPLGYFGFPRLADGLHYQVFADGLQDVAALAFDPNGDLYATLEMRQGRGRIMHIRQGGVREVLAGLDKPDGILVLGDALYISSESGPHGLIEYAGGRRRDLKGVFGAEGIAATREGRILVIEDRQDDGRLLRIDPRTAAIEILLSGLKQAEGVCETPGGDIYFVEKSADRLSRYVDGRAVTVATGLTRPAFLNCVADGSILITEDRTNLGRLLHYRDGRLRILARYLGAPQSVVVGPDGAYYLAEQRRNRIVRIHED